MLLLRNGKAKSFFSPMTAIPENRTCSEGPLVVCDSVCVVFRIPTTQYLNWQHKTGS